MLTSSEKRAIECISTGQRKEHEAPARRQREPEFVIGLVDLYLQLRRCLLGCEVVNIAESDGRFELYSPQGRYVASTGFVWGYSGERPGRPVINFTFPEIGQNSADICFDTDFTLYLLYAKQGAGMDIEGPAGWTTWTEPPGDRPTRKWTVLHGINHDIIQSSKLTEGVQHWRRRWNIAKNDG